MFLQMLSRSKLFNLLVKFLEHNDMYAWFFAWSITRNNNVLTSQYENVVQALKRGDPRLLRHALQEHEDR